MRATLITALAAVSLGTLHGQYKIAPAGAAPSEAAATIGSTLVQDGIKIIKPDGSVLAELWLRSQAPSGGKAEDNASFATIPFGAVLGVMRFPDRHSDRRGQTIKPGVYTVRYGLFPINGDHQGVAPQRDFFVLSPAAEDQKLDTVGDFETLMDMSRKASGTPHPLVFSFWKADAGAKPGFEQAGETDWTLTTKLGDTLITVILIGKHEG